MFAFMLLFQNSRRNVSFNSCSVFDNVVTDRIKVN